MIKLRGTTKFTPFKVALPVFLILVFLTRCKKEENLDIHVLNLNTYTDLFERDTLKIQYDVSRKNLDSVCLLIDDRVCQKQNASESTINYVAESRGYSFRFKLNAYYKTGSIRSSETYYVNVLTLMTPQLEYIIKRDDGYENYFVGEKLSITLKTKFAYQNLDDFREVTLYLNEDSLGTRTAPPFTFITGTIITDLNKISVTLKDANNRLHYVTHEFGVFRNTPPELQLKFSYRHNIPPGYFYTSDSVITVLNAKDNLQITDVDYYLDGNFISRKHVYSESLYFSSFGIGKLSAGMHDTYCIAYDDKGMYSKSETLTMHVYKDIDLDKKVNDVEYSDDERMVFVLSDSILYVLDPVLEQVSRIIDLPCRDAVSMDFQAGENKLYIASRQGRLFTWSASSLALNEIPLPGVSNIEDIEIDNEKNLALINNRKLMSVNLLTGKIINTWTTLDPESTLIFDKPNKSVIVGGTPHISSSYVYIYWLEADTLIYKKRANIGGYARRLELNPNRTEFIISPYINTYRVADLSLLKTYTQQNHSVSVYSADGNYLFISDNWDGIVNIYDTRTILKTADYIIPIEDDNNMNFLLPCKNNRSLVIVTKNVFNSEVKIVFLRLN